MGMRQTVIGCGTVLIGLNRKFIIFLQLHVARLVMRDTFLQNSFDIFHGVVFYFFLKCVIETFFFCFTCYLREKIKGKVEGFFEG